MSRTHQRIDEYCEIYEKLADHLDRLPEGYPETETGLEIRILRRLFTPEEAALALLLSLNPEPAAVIAEKSGLDPLDAARRLEEMSRKGLIFRIGKDHDARYMAIPFLVGIWELHVNDLDPGLIQDVRDYVPHLFNQSTQLKNPQLRTIPISGALPAEQAIMAYEEARGIIAGQDKIVVAPCICRREHKIMGSGCDKPMESCLVFGLGAQFYEENGLGREIGQQEALDILDQAEKTGLVLQPSNAQKVSSICTCCGCCCQILINLKKLPDPSRHAASNYFAAVDMDMCVGCGACLDRCQMEAIEIDGGLASVLRNRCIGCGLCVTTCPEQAIRLQEKPESEKSTPPSTRKERFKILTRERSGK